MKKGMLIGLLGAMALMINVGSAANVSKIEKKQTVVFETEQSFDLSSASLVIDNENFTDFQPVMLVPETLALNDVYSTPVDTYVLGKQKNKVYYRWLLHKKKLC